MKDMGKILGIPMSSLGGVHVISGKAHSLCPIKMEV